MIKVKALKPFDLGQGGGLKYPSRIGQVYELPEGRARKLVALGAAELVEDPKKVAKKAAKRSAKKAEG